MVSDLAKFVSQGTYPRRCRDRPTLGRTFFRQRFRDVVWTFNCGISYHVPAAAEGRRSKLAWRGMLPLGAYRHPDFTRLGLGHFLRARGLERYSPTRIGPWCLSLPWHKG